MRVGVLASLLKVVLVLVRKPPPCSTSVAKQVNPDSRETKNNNTNTQRLQENYWNEWGGEEAPRQDRKPTLRYSPTRGPPQTPTTRSRTPSWRQKGRERGGRGGRCDAKACKRWLDRSEMTRTETNEVEKKNDELQEVRRHPPKIPAKSPLMALHTKPRFRNPP